MGNICKKKQQNYKDENLLQSRKWSNKHTNDYFKLIRHQLNRFYKDNHNNQFNLSISLEKKDFHSNITSKHITINPNQKFIHWKDYMLNYLVKKKHQEMIWTKQLYKYHFII